MPETFDSLLSVSSSLIHWKGYKPCNNRQLFRQRPIIHPKPKPRWEVHLPGAGNRGGSLAGVFRPLIAGPSGSAVSPRLSGWTARPGICRPSPAPPPCSPGTAGAPTPSTLGVGRVRSPGTGLQSARTSMCAASLRSGGRRILSQRRPSCCVMAICGATGR